MFVQSELNVRNRRTEFMVRMLFLMMTLLLILPVLIILGMLVHKGGSVISMDFLFTSPTDGMTAGGIFPALLGTVWLVAVEGDQPTAPLQVLLRPPSSTPGAGRPAPAAIDASWLADRVLAILAPGAAAARAGASQLAFALRSHP